MKVIRHNVKHFPEAKIKFVFLLLKASLTITFSENLKSLGEIKTCLCQSPVVSGVSQAVDALRRGDLLQTFPLLQMRLVVELWDSRVLQSPANRHDALLISEFLPVMKNMVDVMLDSWLKGEAG